MNTMLKDLMGSGLKNWKTTLLGLGIAVLTAMQSGAFDGKHGAELAISVAIFVYGFVSRDANKSSQDSGVRPQVMRGDEEGALPSVTPDSALDAGRVLGFAGLWLCVGGLTGCATNAERVATFAGLDGRQWGLVGQEGVKKAFTELAGNGHGAGGKEVRGVTP